MKLKEEKDDNIAIELRDMAWSWLEIDIDKIELEDVADLKKEEKSYGRIKIPEEDDIGVFTKLSPIGDNKIKKSRCVKKRQR